MESNKKYSRCSTHNTHTKLRRILSVFAFAIAPSVSLASWDGIVTGQIATLEVSVRDGENFGFRVSLDSGQQPCQNGITSAYMNISDNNYEAAASMLLAAKMSAASVTLYSTINPINGYCHLGHIVLAES